MTTPVIIAGGSLAGIAAALRLKQHGIPVCIIEKSTFPRRKLCGEFLGPDSFRVLMQLGLWDLIREASYGPIPHVVFHPQQSQSKLLTVPLGWLNAEHPYGLGISRYVMDELLINAAIAQDIPVLQGHKIMPKIVRHANGFELTVQPPQGDLLTVETPIFIDAGGRQGGFYSIKDNDATISHQENTVRRRDSKQWLGFKANVRLAQPSPHKALHMVFFPGGYGGIQPLSPDIHNICMLATGLADKNIKHPEALFMQTIGQNPAARSFLEGAIAIEPMQTTANLNLAVSRSGAAFIQMGDAMVTVDPVTGSGMAIALQSGILAADAIAVGGDYQAMQQRYLATYHRTFGIRLKLLNGLRPMLFSATGQAVAWPALKIALPVLARLLR